jgi:lipopolysaccharide/colanic/teichoic acid biosynthesis glycosyltransferase
VFRNGRCSAKQRRASPVDPLKVDATIIEEANELDRTARCVDRLDHIEQFSTEASGTDYGETPGRHRCGHLPHTVPPVTASRSWPLGQRKRAFDVLAAGSALVVLSPIVAIVSLLVRLRLGRPVLFRQLRAGLNGRQIVVPKFRTMTNDTATDGSPLPDALRLTDFGRRLRTASLDELPQLWSVLKGDMSIVGPRPLPIAYVSRYSVEQRRRLDVKPGITGWAQVGGRNALHWPEKLALDVWYVDNASLLVDLRILLRTIEAVVRRRGVSAEDHATMPEFMGEP